MKERNSMLKGEIAPGKNVGMRASNIDVPTFNAGVFPSYAGALKDLTVRYF